METALLKVHQDFGKLAIVSPTDRYLSLLTTDNYDEWNDILQRYNDSVDSSGLDDSEKDKLKSQWKRQFDIKINYLFDKRMGLSYVYQKTTDTTPTYTISCPSREVTIDVDDTKEVYFNKTFNDILSVQFIGEIQDNFKFTITGNGSLFTEFNATVVRFKDKHNLRIPRGDYMHVKMNICGFKGRVIFKETEFPCSMDKNPTRVYPFNHRSSSFQSLVTWVLVDHNEPINDVSFYKLNTSLSTPVNENTDFETKYSHYEDKELFDYMWSLHSDKPRPPTQVLIDIAEYPMFFESEHLFLRINGKKPDPKLVYWNKANLLLYSDDYFIQKYST